MKAVRSIAMLIEQAQVVTIPTNEVWKITSGKMTGSKTGLIPIDSENGIYSGLYGGGTKLFAPNDSYISGVAFTL